MVHLLTIQSDIGILRAAAFFGQRTKADKFFAVAQKILLIKVSTESA